jgi:hypothetical protein
MLGFGRREKKRKSDSLLADPKYIRKALTASFRLGFLRTFLFSFDENVRVKSCKTH